jgi:hypothetical protein
VAVVQKIMSAYFAVSGLSALPDFTTLTPYLTELVTNINYPSTDGNFAGSGRAEGRPRGHRKVDNPGPRNEWSRCSDHIPGERPDGLPGGRSSQGRNL